MPDRFTAELIVERYLSGVRVEQFLIRHFRNYTAYRMQRIVASGLVRVNGIAADLKTRVFYKQRIRVELIEPPDKLIEAEPLPLSVVYEDPWIIVVDKPAGQASHPVGVYQTGTLSNALQWHLDRQTALKGLLRPGIVHRLDRMTSGLMVVSKEHLAHRLLSHAFRRGRVAKEYLVLLEGNFERNQGTIDRPIGLHPEGGSILMSAHSQARKAKPARTHFEVVERFDDMTLVRARIDTGRSHQIRVHFAELGHPVVGDEYYGPFGSLRKSPNWVAGPDQPISVQRHALHAHRLTFDHPITGRELSFSSALPDDLELVPKPSVARL